MNRRNLLKGVAGLTAGLILPSTVAENAETARRYWALDRTMARPVSVASGWAYDMGRRVGEGMVQGIPGVVDINWSQFEVRPLNRPQDVVLDIPDGLVRLEFFGNWGAEQISEAHFRFRAFEEDWNGPGMEVYDTI